MAVLKFMTLIIGLVPAIICFTPSCDRDNNWAIYNCAGYSMVGTTLTLDASASGSTPAFAVPKFALQKPNKLYIMKMNFKNIRGRTGINYAHIGFVFNYKDEKNYDFVYARLHSPTVQYGYTQNGASTFVSNLQLNGDRSGARSHSFQIDVLNNKIVNVYYDHVLVGSFNAKFQTLAFGGVLTFNGYQNIVQYGDFQLIA